MNHKFKIFIINSLIFLSSQLYAEIELETKVIDLRYDQNDPPSLIFHLNKNIPEILEAGENWDKYFLIRGGVRIPSHKPNRFRTYFILEPEKETCKEDKINDPSFLIGNNSEPLKEKIKIFRTCLKFKIEDLQKNEIEFASNQNDCIIQKIDKSSALISGGDCFIKAKQNQTLNLEVIPDPLCNNRRFLEESGFSPQEIETTLEAYIYPKAEIGPIFIPVKKLFEKRNLININSGEELLEMVTMDDKNNIPFFRPAYLPFPNVFISSLQVLNQGNLGMIELGFLVSTFGGKDFCKSNLCSKYSNFDIPFAPLLQLYEFDKKNIKKYEIGFSEGVGERLPGQWNGEFKSKVFINKIQFEKGKKYSIELIFSDPVQDYYRLKKYYKTILQNGRFSLGRFQPGLSTMDSFGVFSGFTEEVSALPSLSTDGNFTTSGLPRDPKLSLPRFSTMINDPTFPPEYTKVCNKDLSICNKPSAKEHLKFIINFEVVEVTDSRVTLSDKIEIERVGNLSTKMTTNLDLKNKPTIICK